ncbi:MAG TPA: hypothetical protein VLK36_06865 [Gaiellaceae bacterium]|nr:hypothetical protein [Gaiellaceae bacterium]
MRAHLPTALELADHYIGFVQFTNPAHFPNVDVYAEKGSGIDTLVGLGLSDLSVARPLVEGLRNPTIAREERIRKLIPLELTPFDEAARRALV